MSGDQNLDYVFFANVVPRFCCLDIRHWGLFVRGLGFSLPVWDFYSVFISACP
jgi:hypothetical protein